VVSSFQFFKIQFYIKRNYLIDAYHFCTILIQENRNKTYLKFQSKISEENRFTLFNTWKLSGLDTVLVCEGMLAPVSNPTPCRLSANAYSLHSQLFFIPVNLSHGDKGYI
jgi:hypothetical protein